MVFLEPVPAFRFQLFSKNAMVAALAAALVTGAAGCGSSKGKETDPPARPPRSYSIPVIDLSSDASRRSVVGCPDIQRHYGVSTVVPESAQSVLVVCPPGAGNDGVAIRRGVDGGRRWSSAGSAASPAASGTSDLALYRTFDPQGVKRMVLIEGGNPLRRAVSADDGESWTGFQPAGEFAAPAASALVHLRNGSYLALFGDGGRGYKTVSNDGGRTWRKPVAFAATAGVQFGAPGAVLSPDGRQMAVLLPDVSGAHNSFVTFSQDDGATWTAPRELPAALSGVRPVGAYANDGRLALLFLDQSPQSASRGDWVVWVGSYQDIVMGREGQYRVRLLHAPAGVANGFAGFQLLDDGSYVAVAAGSGTPGGEPEVLSVRFTLRELDARVPKKL